MNFSSEQYEAVAKTLYDEDEHNLVGREVAWEELDRDSVTRKHYRRFAIHTLRSIAQVIDPFVEDRGRIQGPTEASDGRLYGTWPVLLQKGIEVMVGTRQGRYGGVMAMHDGHPYTEKPDEWWEKQGWTIVNPPIHDEVHRRNRERDRG
jgi:hypothetical protein